MTTMAAFDAYLKQMWGCYWGILPYRDPPPKLIIPILYSGAPPDE